MGNVTLVGGDVLTPKGWRRADVAVEAGRIAKVGRVPRPRGAVVDAKGARVVPGLIDLQLNGAYAKSFASSMPEEIRGVAVGLTRLAVTGFLPAVISLPMQKTVEALARIREATTANAGAEILGAHLEGPFLNPGRRGAHRAENIMPPNLVTFSKLAAAGDGIARLMTVAPEVKGAASIIAAGAKRGMVMSIGHSNARREDIEAAIRAGATLVTHLYNAMAAFHQRDDTLVATALTDDRLTCACIYDRHHISRAAMQIALRCKPPGRLVLVSDATAALEAPDGTFEADGTRYTVRGGQVTVSGTATLGGSSVSLLQCVRNVIEDLRLPLEEAWRLASEAPARVLGIEKAKGSIAPGRDGDLVVLDEKLQVRTTVVRGTVTHGDHH